MVVGVDSLVEPAIVEHALAAALARGAEFAEVFVEDRRSTGISLDDRRIEELSSGHDRGAGIRVVVGDTTGFAHTADLSERGLMDAAHAAASVARGADGGTRTVALDRRPSQPSHVTIYPDSVAKAAKVDLLRRADEAARAFSGSVAQVSAGYGDSRRRILVANSEGLFVEDDQIRTRFSVICVASGDTGMQTGYDVLANTIGFELFERMNVEDTAQAAARRAVAKLVARPAPSGVMPIVIKGGTGGILFHEACGHGLEADHIAKDSSVYTGKVGELVASPLVTLVDDGTPADQWGTAAIDDEGRPSQRNVLIDKGVLTDYMWDYLRARKEGRASSGNGRRQSYQHLPMVRMTNTYLENGSDDPDEIVAQTPSGVYVAKLGGGQVNTATGDFVFGMTEAYLIENGQITEPLRDANLIGNGPDVLRKVDAVGNDFDMCPGTCGKDGQSVPVGCGQATMRVSGITVAEPRMPELIDLATKIAEAARPGEQVEAYVAWHRDTDIRVYEGAIESLASAESAGIGIRVVVDHRQGFAYVGSLDENLGREALNEARDNAGFASSDEHLGLAEPDGVKAAILDLWDDGVAGFAGEAKIDLAIELERQVRSGDPRIRQVTSADYSDALSESAIVSSAGISASSRRTTCYVGVDAVAGEGGETQTGDGYTVGRGPATLDLEKAARDAVDRATRLLGARKPSSERVDVVLDRRVTATLLGILASTLSGEEVAKGRSLFTGRLGEIVATSSLTLVDDPTDRRAFSAGSFDAEGLACRRNVLIDAGQLSGFLYDTYSGRLAGTRSTGSAVRGGFKSTPGVGARALALVPGELDQEAIIASMGRGLLVQSISGVHSGVNTVSGDFSVGAQGLMIRDGALAEPVREFTIASTLQRMLQRVIAIGSDLEWLPSVASGVSLAIGDLALSGA